MFYIIPSQVFSHIQFVKKLCIVILHLLGHTGSIPFLWTPFFYLLKPFTPLLGDSEGVKECQSLPWCVKSNIPTLCGQKMSKHAGNTQLCVIKLLLSADKPTPYFWVVNKVSKTRPMCEYIRYMYMPNTIMSPIYAKLECAWNGWAEGIMNWAIFLTTCVTRSSTNLCKRHI